MKNGKFAKRGIATKVMLVVLSLMMVVGVSVGATIAWLTDKTEVVQNTFSPSNIDITLTETWNADADGDGKNDAWTAQLIPGKEYVKDPVVAVNGEITNVDCYLFVKFEEINTPKTYLAYTSLLTEDAGWKELKEGSGIWYREVKEADAIKSWNLLDGNKVTVLSTLTKDDTKTTNTPSLKYTAYAIQTVGFEGNPAAAWTEVSKLA